MPNMNENSLAVCIQALQKAIRFNDFISQSDTVDSDNYEESSYMFELELSRLCELYKIEEKNGNVSIPLSSLLTPPFDELIKTK
ncbi:hypothetical protein [Sessilibacter corallicola]|uniref:Uncharacterized protein n=1 Tax=Sessilibacter corallicola TaxID=2904075 RepID=A0ABQ0AEQ2_9GAMM